MKTKRVSLNVIINLIVQVSNIVLMILVRRVFSETLGDTILGLNSLYTSLLSLLTLSELGLGVTTAVFLYKPLAEENEEKVASYMDFLRKAYKLIGIFVIVSGTLFLPILPMIVKENFEHAFMGISYELYVFSTAISYFMSYKKVILAADQKNYILNISQAAYKITQGIGQLVVLYYFKNYYVFIIIAVVCSLLENYIMACLCDHWYPYITKPAKPLDTEEKRNIKIKVMGMLCHKIANYLIQGTDNVIISTFQGAIAVTYYNNYNLISVYIYAVFANFAVTAVAGLGRLLYTEQSRLEFVFSKMLIVQQYLFSFSASAFFILAPFFVNTLFPSTGAFQLSSIILMTLIIYLRGYSEAVESMRNCIGDYSDKLYDLLVALLNVVISVILVQKLGISGVLIGTLICYLIKELILTPYVVFRKVFPGGIKKYLYKTMINAGLFMLISAILYIATKFYSINTWWKWLIYGMMTLLVSVFVNTIIYRKTREFREIKEYIINQINIKGHWRKTSK